jgi:hypothetical protein
MKKLRNVLAAALLTIPLASMGASSIMDASTGQELRPTRSVTSCCWTYFMGRYWCLPC